MTYTALVNFSTSVSSTWYLLPKCNLPSVCITQNAKTGRAVWKKTELDSNTEMSITHKTMHIFQHLQMYHTEHCSFININHGHCAARWNRLTLDSTNTTLVAYMPHINNTQPNLWLHNKTAFCSWTAPDTLLKVQWYIIHRLPQPACLCDPAVAGPQCTLCLNSHQRRLGR